MSKCDKCDHTFKAKPEPAETAFQVLVREYLKNVLYADWHTQPWEKIAGHWPRLVKGLDTFRKAVLDEAIEAAKKCGYGQSMPLLLTLEVLKEKGASDG